MITEQQERIRLSCRLEVLPGRSMIERFEAAAGFGFDAVSLPGRTLTAYLDELRGCLGAIPVPIVSISLGFRGSLVSPVATERRLCHDSLLEVFDLCFELGASLFNMPPVLIQDNRVRIASPNAEKEQDDLLVQQLPALAEAAGDRGVTLVIEPVNRYESEYMNSIRHATRICAMVNHAALGATCDFFHMQMEELIIEESLREALPWIRHVHVAENTRVEPGPGSLDLAPGLAVLKAGGYAGFLEVECRTLSGPAETVLPRSAHYLRELWQRA